MRLVSASNALTKPLRFSSASLVQSRGLHEVVVQPRTGRVIQSKGPGGRHSSTGHVATVFGATGFLGRYLVSKLAKAGTQVIIPYREWEDSRHLRVCGDLGQIVPMEWDLENDSQIDECVRHSDTVYNLTGRDYETKNFSFTDVHVTGARRIARIAHSAGVSRFIHVSHLNAAPDSESQYYRSKFAGEIAVREGFPEATIVRPAWLYGHEDRLLNTMAVSPSVFRVNDGDTRIRPVHVLDVAQALTVMLSAPSTASSTFALAGPKTYTYATLMSLIESVTLKKLSGPNFPKPMLMLAARLWDFVWWKTVSPDEVTRRYLDDVSAAEELRAVGVNGELLKGFAELGIEPDVVEDAAITYLRRHRSSAYYDVPIPSGGLKLKRPTYHVIE